MSQKKKKLRTMWITLKKCLKTSCLHCISSRSLCCKSSGLWQLELQKANISQLQQTDGS